jgi:hypothetical protein
MEMVLSGYNELGRMRNLFLFLKRRQKLNQNISQNFVVVYISAICYLHLLIFLTSVE